MLHQHSLHAISQGMVRFGTKKRAACDYGALQMEFMHECAHSAAYFGLAQ
jgi:hypothetical protein